MSSLNMNEDMPPDQAPSDLPPLREILARSRTEDYDGHTEFRALTPRARLDWLGAAVLFIEAQRQRRRTGRADRSPLAGS
jgi:hypothetical protein